MRIAQCRCGALRAACEGEPVRVSVCHCLECQRRTGSAFAAQARFPSSCVTVTGAARVFQRTGASGGRASYRFCPECGSTVVYENEGMEGMVAIPLGAFADPGFPAPRFSVHENRRHHWVEIGGDDVEHDDG